MQNRHAGDAVAESTEERPAAVAPTRDAKYSGSRSENGQMTGNGPGAATQQAGGGNGGEPTIRELQIGIQANRQRIIRLDDRVLRFEKQTKKGFKRTHRKIRELRGGQTRMAAELRELRDLQREMRGQMRAMIWIMGVIGGVTVLAVLGGVLIPAVARLMAPLGAG